MTAKAKSKPLPVEIEEVLAVCEKQIDDDADMITDLVESLDDEEVFDDPTIVRHAEALRATLRRTHDSIPPIEPAAPTKPA